MRQKLLDCWRKLSVAQKISSIPQFIVKDIVSSVSKKSNNHKVLFFKKWRIKSPCRQKAFSLPEDSHPHLNQIFRVSQPWQWLACLRSAEVTGPSIGVITCERALLAEVSIEWSHPPENHGIMRRFFLPRAKKLTGKTLCLASTGGDNYYHWMIDVLPRINLINKAKMELSLFDNILINSRQKRFQIESMNQVGLPTEKLVAIKDRCRYQCQELWLPSLPSAIGHPTPETVAFLQKLFLPLKATSKRRKLLIGRPRGASRQVTGWEEFKNLLIRMGFQEVQPETLSIKEQAQVFFEAEWVIGIHGAALTNIVFCRPGTKIVEILGQQYVNPCYRALSEAAGLRYHALLGSGHHTGPVLRLDQPKAPIRLELQKAKRLLEMINLT